MHECFRLTTLLMVKRLKWFNWKTWPMVKSHKRGKPKKHRGESHNIILEIQNWQGFLLSFLALLCSSSPTGQVWVGTAGEPTRKMHLGEEDGQDSTERWQAGGRPCRGGTEQCRKQEKAATSQWGSSSWDVIQGTMRLGLCSSWQPQSSFASVMLSHSFLTPFPHQTPTSWLHFLLCSQGLSSNTPPSASFHPHHLWGIAPYFGNYWSASPPQMKKAHMYI